MYALCSDINAFLKTSEIHGPWDEARPRLQRPRRNVYRKRSN